MSNHAWDDPSKPNGVAWVGIWCDVNGVEGRKGSVPPKAPEKMRMGLRHARGPTSTKFAPSPATFTFSNDGHTYAQAHEAGANEQISGPNAYPSRCACT